MTTTKKQTKAARIAELERKLQEALAGQVHVYHHACRNIAKAGAAHMDASGVVITLTALGGRQIVAPTLILGGLSDASIAALKADFVRSFDYATAIKPQA
jgi:hypothetical protein